METTEIFKVSKFDTKPYDDQKMGTSGLTEHSLLYQVIYVTQRGVLRGMVNLCPFAGIQFTFKSIPQHVDYFPLTLADINAFYMLPKIYCSHIAIYIIRLLCHAVKNWSIHRIFAEIALFFLRTIMPIYAISAVSR